MENFPAGDFTVEATDPAITPEIINSVDACRWAITSKIQLATGVFQLKNHEYLREPMESEARIEVDMKGTQGGFTEKEVIRSLHGLIHGKYPQGVLYLFPTADDVLEFSKSRFQPLIRSNVAAIGKYVRSGGRHGTDMASLKRIGDAYLYLRGARLSQKLGYGDASESGKLRSIPVDKCVFDEYDLMDEEARQKALSRMGHSLVKEERYMSNPTIPDFGIDVLFQKSTQSHWYRKCEHHGGDFSSWTCAELTFPDCVKTGSDNKGFIACIKCGRPVGISPGEWVPKYRDKAIIGRRWSQLTSVYNDPAEILAEFNDPPENNLGDVYRYRLGLPYIPTEDRLREAQVFECCKFEVIKTHHPGPCAMGVDIGKTKHVIIGTRIGRDQFEIHRIERIPQNVDFKARLHFLCKQFNVRSAVLDIRPYEDEVREFQRQEKFRIYLCQYNENTIRAVNYDEKNKIVKVNRTEIFDATHRIIRNRNIVLPRQQIPEVQVFALQCCATAKVMETNKKTRDEVYRYKKLGADHYRNALNYFYIAAQGGRIPSVTSIENRQTVADGYHSII